MHCRVCRGYCVKKYGQQWGIWYCGLVYVQAGYLANVSKHLMGDNDINLRKKEINNYKSTFKFDMHRNVI
jgi:hypothetical protein